MVHGASCSEACGILLNHEPLAVCPWSPLFLLWTLCPHLHRRDPHCLSFLFSLLPKKCCFYKADLSSLSLFFFLIVGWQTFSAATGDSSSITKYIQELLEKCGLFLGHKVAASSETQADVKMDPRGMVLSWLQQIPAATPLDARHFDSHILTRPYIKPINFKPRNVYTSIPSTFSASIPSSQS